MVALNFRQWLERDAPSAPPERDAVQPSAGNSRFDQIRSQIHREMLNEMDLRKLEGIPTDVLEALIAQALFFDLRSRKAA